MIVILFFLNYCQTFLRLLSFHSGHQATFHIFYKIKFFHLHKNPPLRKYSLPLPLSQCSPFLLCIISSFHYISRILAFNDCWFTKIFIFNCPFKNPFSLRIIFLHKIAHKNTIPNKNSWRSNILRNSKYHLFWRCIHYFKHLIIFPTIMMQL